MPTVSIVIPTHNRVRLLQEAVLALTNQSHVPDEIIVVDDGSSDETAAFLAGAPFPLVVIQQENQGRSAARNAGLRVARGEWIILHDDDDILPRTSIQLRLESIASDPSVDVWYGDTALVDEEGRIIGLPQAHDFRAEGDVFPLVAEENRYSIHAAIFRRSCLEDSGLFDTSPTLTSCEDWDFWIRVAANSRVGCIPAIVAHYRRDRKRKHISELDSMACDAWTVQTRVFDMQRFSALTPLEQARIYRRYSIRCLRIGRSRLAADSLWEALKRAPDLRTRLAGVICTFVSFLPPGLQLKVVHAALMLRDSLVKSVVVG